MDHAGHMMMDSTTMAMNHSGHIMATTMGMNHSSMDHSSMDHSSMDHSSMDHSSMDHSSMDHSSMDHGSMDMSDMTMDMPGMKMYFHAGYEEFVLFYDCLTASAGAMVGACFAIFFLAILYEGLKFLREVLLQRSLSTRRPASYNLDGSKAGTSREQIATEIINTSAVDRIFSSSHCVQTILHMVQVFISYCLMLVFMTYNVWLCLAVILGAGVGYFMFGWKRAVVVDSNEHCH